MPFLQVLLKISFCVTWVLKTIATFYASCQIANYQNYPLCWQYHTSSGASKITTNSSCSCQTSVSHWKSATKSCASTATVGQDYTSQWQNYMIGLLTCEFTVNETAKLLWYHGFLFVKHVHLGNHLCCHGTQCANTWKQKTHCVATVGWVYCCILKPSRFWPTQN